MKKELFFSRGSFITLINFRAQTQGAQTRYSAECMLSCHVRVLEWIYTIWLPDCHGFPYLKLARYLKFKWQQRDSNPQPLPLAS